MWLVLLEYKVRLLLCLLMGDCLLPLLAQIPCLLLFLRDTRGDLRWQQSGGAG
jgi:hypothetical protein